MEQTILSVPMDADIKRRFDSFCEDIGMSTAELINLFAKAVLKEKRIPFVCEGFANQRAIMAQENGPSSWVNLLIGAISLPEEDKHKCVKELITDYLVEDYENLN